MKHVLFNNGPSGVYAIVLPYHSHHHSHTHRIDFKDIGCTQNIWEKVEGALLNNVAVAELSKRC